MVRKPLISIKDSLRNTAPPASVPAQEAITGEVGDSSSEDDTPKTISVLEAWKAYTASIKKDKPRVFATLDNNPPMEENGVFRITLNSDAQLENFRSNIRPALLTYICRSTGMEGVKIEAVLAEAEARKKKVYTDKDKLEFLVKKNPDMTEFYSRFSLDFDR